MYWHLSSSAKSIITMFGMNILSVPPDEYEAAIIGLKRDIQVAQDKVEAEFKASEAKAVVGAAEGKKMKAEINKDDIESADSE